MKLTKDNSHLRVLRLNEIGILKALGQYSEIVQRTKGISSPPDFKMMASRALALEKSKICFGKIFWSDSNCNRKNDNFFSENF